MQKMQVIGAQMRLNDFFADLAWDGYSSVL